MLSEIGSPSQVLEANQGQWSSEASIWTPVTLEDTDGTADQWKNDKGIGSSCENIKFDA